MKLLARNRTTSCLAPEELLTTWPTKPVDGAVDTLLTLGAEKPVSALSSVSKEEAR